MIRFLTHSAGAFWLLISPHFAFGNEMIEDTLVVDTNRCLSMCTMEFAKNSAECANGFSTLTCDERADATFAECEKTCPQEQQVSQVDY